MQTIIITGTNGLLGQKILYALKKTDVQIIAVAKGPNRTSNKYGYHYIDADVSNQTLMAAIFETYRPNTIIHTVALTNVDICETQVELCWQLNVKVVDYLAKLCQQYGTHFIHLSTDFIFDGNDGPYTETDKPNPLSVYAKSKLASEEIVKNLKTPWAIIRTIIIYGVVDDGQRSNIVLWVKQSLEKGLSINVITDQIRNPTLAEDLADACIQCAFKKATGVFHVSGPETMSIWDCAIATAKFFDLDTSLMKPVTTAQLKQPALRPLITGFNIEKAITQLNYKPHTLQQGLTVIAKQLNNKN
jgi:dTDP-4-dehydrorhamnose reductase